MLLLLWEIWHACRFLIFPVDIKAKTKNSKKKNLPLNSCMGGIRLEGCILLLDLATCYLLYNTCIMHTYITYRSCIILTLYLVAIIKSSESSCVWKQKGGRLERAILSPQSIAKEILTRLEKSSINVFYLEAPPAPAPAVIPIRQTKEIEHQRGNRT